MKRQDEPTLFDTMPRARATDPDTSHAAAAAAARTAPTHRRRVLAAYIDAFPRGLTDHEADEISGVPESRKRRVELVEAGLIERTGERRMSPRGVESIVWRATVEAVRNARLGSEVAS